VRSLWGHRSFAGPDKGLAASNVPLPNNARYWFEAFRLVGLDGGGNMATWGDFTGNGWNLQNPAGGHTQPTIHENSINGLPGVYFGNPGGGGASDWAMAHYGGPFDTVPGNYPPGTPYPFAQNEPHIVYVVCKPLAGAPPGGGVAGGMLVSDRLDGFERQLWTLGAAQQRLARRAGTNLLYVNPAVDYTNIPLFITYQWTGTDMIETINGVVQVTIDLFSGLPSTAFPASADNIGTHQLEVGGSPSDESGFQGDINLVLLAPDVAPNARTVNYINQTWGPF